MTSEEQFIKWARFYIFIISAVHLLISAPYFIYENNTIYFLGLLMLFNFLISIGGLLSLRRREIQYYLTVLQLRLIVDSFLLLYLIDQAESVYDLISSILFITLFLLGPELFILKIFQNPDKFSDE
ncbi:MAG: hypothetical protein GPJ54_03320 [Candidatus Heimdallarchaeota archaeon]|nr:hypothetical protein [Candidatus Heimdallarchaeota archaeon]